MGFKCFLSESDACTIIEDLKGYFIPGASNFYWETILNFHCCVYIPGWGFQFHLNRILVRC